ncbi:MAG TPA: hypothetical protein VKA64_04590, partial [Gammaproteobacteria bacterium]|nr:hypothetical protein [Gammaproteobacteria bacterium]
MKVIIQCAARKDSAAGYLKTRDGQRVLFVAHPEKAPRSGDVGYAKPDDRTEDGRTWRQVLVEYNQSADANPLGLVPAYRLYEDPRYAQLVTRFGVDNVMILSAGWGLLPADFLTPQ